MKNTIIFLISVLFLSTAYSAGNHPGLKKEIAKKSAKASRPQEVAPFKCISGLPTSTFILEKSPEKANTMLLKMIHHNGIPFMPIFQGIVVPNDLQYLKDKVEVMGKLGDYVTFEFPSEYCKKYDDQVYSCSHGSSQFIDGVEYQAFSLTTSVMTRKVYEYNWTYNRVTLMVYISGHAPVEEFTMDYYENECQF